MQTDTIILFLPNRRVMLAFSSWSRAVLLTLATRPRRASTQRRSHHARKRVQSC